MPVRLRSGVARAGHARGLTLPSIGHSTASRLQGLHFILALTPSRRAVPLKSNVRRLTRMKPESRHLVTVIAGFAGFICISLIGVYVSNLLPGAVNACTNRCAAQGKEGHLVYKGPPTTKNTTYASDCECGSPLSTARSP